MTIAPDHALASVVAQLSSEHEVLRASTRRLLLALIDLDDEALGVASTTGLGTRRHVLARLVAHAERTLAELEGRSEPAQDDTLLRMTAADLADAVAGSLGTLLGALETRIATVDGIGGARLHAIVSAAGEQLAWLELTHVDLGLDYDVATIPDPAIDAVATHFHDADDSPFTGLVRDDAADAAR